MASSKVKSKLLRFLKKGHSIEQDNLKWMNDLKGWIQTQCTFVQMYVVKGSSLILNLNLNLNEIHNLKMTYSLAEFRMCFHSTFNSQQMQGAGCRFLIAVVKPQDSLAHKSQITGVKPQDPHHPYHVMCDPYGGQKRQILCYFWVSIVTSEYS